MMSRDKIRLAMVLLPILDELVEFRESFEDPEYSKYPVVKFEDISVSEFYKKDGRQSVSFQGNLEIPKTLAIEMFKWLEQRTREELEKIGVKV